MVVYESDKGALCLAVPYCIAVADEATYTGKTTVTIVKGDGEVMTRSVENLKKVFGWDGQDPFWLTETDLTNVEFDVVGEQEQYVPPEGEPRITFRVKYLNPPGGGMQMPQSADRKSILAKYGSKFRALAGPTKPAPAAPKPAPKKEEEKPAPEKPSAKKSPPGRSAVSPSVTAPTTTMDEAWAACQAANPQLDEEQQGEVWYAKVEEMFPGKTNSDLSIQQFDKLKEFFSAK
jgi:hypothetical protein